MIGVKSFRSLGENSANHSRFSEALDRRLRASGKSLREKCLFFGHFLWASKESDKNHHMLLRINRITSLFLFFLESKRTKNLSDWTAQG